MGLKFHKTVTILLVTGYLFLVAGSQALHYHGPVTAVAPGESICASCTHELHHDHSSKAEFQQSNSRSEQSSPQRHREGPADEHEDCLVCAFLAQTPILVAHAVEVVCIPLVEEVIQPKPIRRPRDLPSPLQSRAPPLG